MGTGLLFVIMHQQANCFMMMII